MHLTNKTFKFSTLVVVIACSGILLYLLRGSTAPRERSGRHAGNNVPSTLRGTYMANQTPADLTSISTPTITSPSTAETPGDHTTVTSLSQHPNIDERGKWQKQQVESYCRKYNLEGMEYQFPTNSWNRNHLFEQLIFDDERKIIFAFIPKVGCTNMRRFLFVLQGAMPEETIYLKKVSETTYLVPAMHTASFWNKELNDFQRIEKLKHYYKFTIVRNPLERLLSAYKDKFEPVRSVYSIMYVTETQRVMALHRSEELEKWKESNDPFKFKINFTEYIEWVVETRNDKLNPHFAPVINNIYPCRFKYDFYGNFKLLGQDVGKIIEKLHAPPNYYYNASQHSPGHETRDYLEEYYAQLDKELKLRLFHDFYQELDFYYHLFPEERTSHMKLLEVDELVV